MLELNNFYIDGRWMPAASTAIHTLVDATTEQPFGTVALAGTDEVDAAVAAAKRAFPAWAESDPAARIALVRRIYDIYAGRVEEMARVISQEMGAPIELARTRQAAAGLRHMTSFLTAMEHFDFVRPLGPHAPDDRILMQPIGVVGLITPWNWPMSQVALKVIPALLAGCTMVLKPSELAPLSSNLLAEIIHEAGAPAGVFNLVQGDGATAGARLVEHPDVAMISFTGSTRAGASIMRWNWAARAPTSSSPMRTRMPSRAACAIASSTAARTATRQPGCWSSVRSMRPPWTRRVRRPARSQSARHRQRARIWDRSFPRGSSTRSRI
jgi:aldehyde dehydrogenase (NAD+)